jgi:hypothetical protein
MNNQSRLYSSDRILVCKPLTRSVSVAGKWRSFSACRSPGAVEARDGPVARHRQCDTAGMYSTRRSNGTKEGIGWLSVPPAAPPRITTTSPSLLPRQQRTTTARSCWGCRGSCSRWAHLREATRRSRRPDGPQKRWKQRQHSDATGAEQGAG